MSTRQGDSSSQDGFALVSAVWALAVLLIIASGLIEISGSGVRHASIQLERSQALAFADAVLLDAVQRLQSPGQEDRLKVDATPTALEIMNESVLVRVQDEFGKVDLNTAATPELAAMLQAGGMSSAGSAGMASAIVDARRPPEAVGGDETARNTSFEDTSQLLLIPGMTPELMSKIEPGLTVFSGLDHVDPDVAPYMALMSMPGMTPLRAWDLIHRRSAEAQGAGSGSAVSNGRIAAGVDFRGWPLLIEASFDIGQHMYGLHAVIRLTGTLDPPYLLSTKTVRPVGRRQAGA